MSFSRLIKAEDGPVTDSDGTQKWYQDGKLHRDDGPAVIYPDGTQYWYQNGVEVEPF